MRRCSICCSTVQQHLLRRLLSTKPARKRVIGVAQAVGDSESQRKWQKLAFGASGKLEPCSKEQTYRPRAVAQTLLSTVLPAGYPESVKASYTPYIKWQFVSMISTSAAGVMSTQALLHAVGLGVGAIPMAAALNWVIKDGFGQLGGVMFSSLVNTRFDANPKLWRMVAALSLDASTALELLSPLLPGSFLLIASVANVGKNISFLAASASRAAIHYSFAERENLADITAKAGAQSILASMAGTGIGIALSALLGSEWSAVAPAAAVLCTAHLVSTYMSLRPVVLPTIDQQRLELILDSLKQTGSIPSPAAVSARETIFTHTVRALLRRDDAHSPRVVLGAAVTAAVADSAELQQLCTAAPDSDQYILVVRADEQQRAACVYLLLKDGCSSADVLAGAHHAYRAKQLLLQQGYCRALPLGSSSSSSSVNSGSAGSVLLPAVTAAARPIDAAAFAQGLQQHGWHTEVLFFEDQRHTRMRLEYDNEPLP
jgi:Vitamin B6 photo-protection and homoeostasis